MQVFKSTHFDGEVVFHEEESAVDEFDILKKEVIFRDEEIKKRVNEEYYERVIRCKPKRYYANFQSEYFVSQAYRPTEVFVFRSWDNPNRIAIENLFGGVRFRI